jgi:hypothetical protein
MEHTPNDCPEERSLRTPADWFDEPFLILPTWLARRIPELPAESRSLIIILFAQLGGTMPWGGPLELAELARRAYLEEEQTTSGLRPLIDLGWVVEEPARCYRVNVDVAMRAPVASQRHLVRVPEAPLIPDVVLIPPDLLQVWLAYLGDDEIRIVTHLAAQSWTLRQADAHVSLDELARAQRAPGAATGRKAIPIARVERALDRLRLMEALWQIKAPPGDETTAPGVYRVNARWHKFVEELRR